MPYKINPFTGNLTITGDELPPADAGKVLVAKDKDNWDWEHPHSTIGSTILSAPPSTGGLRVINIYVSSVTGKTVVEFEDTFTYDSAGITSSPPQGHHKVTNIYVDPQTNRTVVDYDNTPQP